MTPQTKPDAVRGALVWLGLRPTPLRRVIDRVEIAARWVAVTAVIGALLPAAMVAGRVGQDLTAQTERASRLYSTTAVVVDHPSGLSLGPGPGALGRVRARWVAADGRTHWGAIMAPDTTKRGDRVRIRLDAQGNPVEGSISPLGVAVVSALAGLAVPVMTALAGCLWLLGVRRGLRRSAERYWDRSWAAYCETGSLPS